MNLPQDARPVLARCPIGAGPTTNQTTMRDFRASRIQAAIEEALLGLNDPDVDDCHAWSHVVPRFIDTETHDATVMLLADWFFRRENPMQSRRVLSLPVMDRGKYLRAAMAVIQLQRRVLEGQDDGALLQAAADWHAHKSQVSRVVPFTDVNGNSLTGEGA